MKKLITLLAVAFAANLSIGQTVFESDLSSWAAGDPTDFFGSRTSLSSSNCTEVTTGAMYGTSFANLVNSTSSHKRLTTQPIAVMSDSTYIIKMYITGTAGDIRVSHYDITGSSYGPYTSYQSISGTSQMIITDTVIASTGCASLEYIISFRNTSALGIALDSVAILGAIAPPPPPPVYLNKTINDIQFTTDPSGDSPYKDSLVRTTGIVTGTGTSGYFIQDGGSSWSGVYVYDNVNTPNRGDEITVTGKVIEYFDLTEITNIDSVITVSTGNSLPTPVAVTSSSINDESYEGVLVKVSAVMCVDSNAGFGEWDVANTGLDTLAVDDLLFAYVPVQYQGYDVTGLVQYSFGEFKLEPRDSMDIVQNITVSLNELSSELNLSVFPNPVSSFFTIEGVNLGTAEIMNAEGKIIRSISLNYINMIDVSDLTNGVYIIKVISENKVGFTRFVKQ